MRRNPGIPRKIPGQTPEKLRNPMKIHEKAAGGRLFSFAGHAEKPPEAGFLVDKGIAVAIK